MTFTSSSAALGLAEGYAASLHNTDAEASVVFDMAPWTGATAAFSMFNHNDAGGDVTIKLQTATDPAGSWTDVTGMVYTLPALTNTELAVGWTFRSEHVSRYVRALVTIPGASTWIGSMVWVGAFPTNKRPSGFGWDLDADAL